MRLEETAEIQATSSSAFQASFPFKVTDVYRFRQEIFNCGNVRYLFATGWSCLHSLVNIILAYLLLQLGGPQALTVILMFVLNVVSTVLNSATRTPITRLNSMN